MTEYESAIIGYALRIQNPNPVLRLKGKFSEERFNQLASIASTVHFDLVQICDALEKFQIPVNSHDLVVMMNGSIVNESGIESYILKAEEDYATRRSEEVLKKVFDKPVTRELVADLIKDLTSVNTVKTEEPSVEQAIKEFEDVQEKFVNAHSDGKSIVGLSTGYYELDKMTDGLQEHHLWTVAAYTSTGKTTFALNVVKALLDQDVSVVFYSLEMSRSEIYAKLISMESGISIWNLKRAGINEQDYETFKEAREKSKNWKLKIYDKKNDIQELTQSMKEESLRGGKVFVIDYLQNIADSRAKSEYDLITNAVHDIQNLTLSLNVSTILISQISNEDSKNTSMLNVNAKGSGGVRAASDLFLYLRNTLKETDLLQKYRTKENVPMQLVISKHRHGRIGAIEIEREQETGVIIEMPNV